MEATIWICLLTLLLVPVFSTPTYVGCYDSTFVHSDDFFLAPLSLPSVECLGVCDNRLTRYAGVQSLPTYDYCFCGNDLLEHSTRVDTSTCIPCSDVTTMCGTNKTVALYKLRDSTPVAVLLATGNGVEMFKENASTVIIPENTRVTWVDFSYAEDTIFFRQDNTVSRSSYSYLMLKYIKPMKIYSYLDRLDELAVDWIHKKLFFVDFIPDEIKEVHYNGGGLKLVFDNDNIIRDLHIDPYFGVLFFIDSSEFLHSFLLQNETLRHYDNTKMHYYSTKKIALDIHEQVVYMVVQLDENSPLYLVSTVYDDSKTPTVLFHGPELTSIEALDVFHGDVYWVNYKDDRSSMYRCRLTPRCHTDNLIVMYHFVEVISDMRVFHPYKQSKYQEKIIIEPDSKSREDVPTTTVVEVNSGSKTSSSQPTTGDKHYKSSTLPETTTASNRQQLTNEDKKDGSSIHYLLIANIIGLTLIVFGLPMMYVKLTRRIKLAGQPVTFRNIPPQHTDSNNTYVEITDFQRKPCSE